MYCSHGEPYDGYIMQLHLVHTINDRDHDHDHDHDQQTRVDVSLLLVPRHVRR